MKQFAYFSLALVVLITANTYSQFQLQKAFPNLTFYYPVGIYSAGDGTDRIFVVEQSGKIKVFENNRNTSISQTFLDISDRAYFNYDECGLLGLAFHPDYKTNGYFYVDYVANNPLRTVIARYQVSSTNPDSAVKSSEEIILTIPQPYDIVHKGGQLNFGSDGLLYIGMGDGGPEGDPDGHGQDLQLLLGKILRIDVDHPSDSLNYSIPASNPFYQNTLGYKQEIYAYGLRNPWRFNFDKETGLLWCGDVGQDSWEEIDLIQSGMNYGWNCYEGFHTYNMTNCSGNNYTFPVFEYGHTNGSCAIIGGFEYRGKRRPELTGKYIYGDYCTGNIWQFQLSDSSNILAAQAPTQIYSFGEDMSGELYIGGMDNNIYEFVPAINAPTSLHAELNNSGKITLTWADNSSNENGFIIQRKGTGNIFTNAGIVGANDTTYTDTVSFADNYIFRVIAYNDSAYSDYSNEASIIITTVPVELISFNAALEGNEVYLTWNTATELNNRGFYIEKYYNGNWQQIGFVQGNGTTTQKKIYHFKDYLGWQPFHGTVLYELKLIDLDGSLKYSNAIPVNIDYQGISYSLSQNYPNPFNPSTIINYAIPRTSQVIIKLYDIIGNEIETLVNGVKQPGSYQINFEGSKLPSGVYFYKMTANNYISIKKLILLK